MSMHSVPPAAHRTRDMSSPAAPGRRWLATLGRAAGVLALLPMSGCTLELLDPKGSIGEQEKQLILIALGVMLLVVIPVILLTLYFGWRYRESNTSAKYSPKWAHSTRIEIVVWTIPVLIVIALAVIIWETTHSLDPYKPLESDVKPVRVEVVALNWKWLFIYPDYGVATVNQLPLPVDTPVEFKLTAESLMNSFFIPQLGSMVYTMAGMQTKLHLIANHTGDYLGMSAAYSGAGFSDMKFKARVVDRATFDQWVKQAQASPSTLDADMLRKIEQPGTGVPIAVFANVTPGMFDGIVGKYMGMAQGAAPAEHGAMPGMTMPPAHDAMQGTGAAIKGASLDTIIDAANCRVAAAPLAQRQASGDVADASQRTLTE